MSCWSISSRPRRCPGTGVAAAAFWGGLAGLVRAISRRRTAALLAMRDRLQAQIDDWHGPTAPAVATRQAIEAFLQRDRLSGAGAGRTSPSRRPGVDPEIATICGPQLVVPVSNARYALNAANARWGSLYDALYGTDAIPRDGELAPGKGYNPGARRGGDRMGARRSSTRRFRLTDGSHARRARGYRGGRTERCRMLHRHGSGAPALARSGAVRRLSWRDPERRVEILLEHNGLHVELVIDRRTRSGRAHPARVSRRAARGGADHDPGLRGFGRRRRCRGQGRGLSQLARADERHAGRAPSRRAASRDGG